MSTVSSCALPGGRRCRRGQQHDATCPQPSRPAAPTPALPTNRPAAWSIRSGDLPTGGSARTVAAMRKAGLPVLAYSKWRFVRGSDLIAFLAGASEATRKPQSET